MLHGSEQADPTSSGEPESSVNNPKHAFRRLAELSRRVPRPNPQAWVVIALTIVGLLALLGDIPSQDSNNRPTIHNTSRAYHQSFIEETLESNDGSFVPLDSILTIGVSLPSLPRKHGTIKGQLTISAIVDHAGTYNLYVTVPAPATISLWYASAGERPDAVQTENENRARLLSMDEAAKLNIISSYAPRGDPPVKLQVIKIPFTTSSCGEEITATLNFSSHSPGLLKGAAGHVRTCTYFGCRWAKRNTPLPRCVRR
jgi:hypothetical protein